MKDKSDGGMIAAVIAVPVMIACCAGGIGLSVSALAGSAAYISGAGMLVAALSAAATVGAAMAVRSYWGSHRSPVSMQQSKGVSDA